MIACRRERPGRVAGESRRPAACPGLKPPGSQRKPAEAGWRNRTQILAIRRSPPGACPALVGFDELYVGIRAGRRGPSCRGAILASFQPASAGFPLSARRLEPRARAGMRDPSRYAPRVPTAARLRPRGTKAAARAAALQIRRRPAFVVSPGGYPRARATAVAPRTSSYGRSRSSPLPTLGEGSGVRAALLEPCYSVARGSR